MSNILCTGSRGFIGSHVVWKLRLHGHNVDTFDRGYEFGLLQPSYDCIVHCAANLFHHFEENIALTFKLCMQYPDTHMIFTSSAAVYGEAILAKEEDVLHPFGSYGKAKYIEELIIQEYIPRHTILRLGNVYGYHSDHGIISKITQNEHISIPYPDHVRDFVHVDDVVWAIQKARRNEEKWKGIFNIASGKGISMKDLWEKIYPGKPLQGGTPTYHEIGTSILDITKVKKLGFSPNIL